MDRDSWAPCARLLTPTPLRFPAASRLGRCLSQLPRLRIPGAVAGGTVTRVTLYRFTEQVAQLARFYVKDADGTVRRESIGCLDVGLSLCGMFILRHTAAERPAGGLGRRLIAKRLRFGEHPFGEVVGDPARGPLPALSNSQPPCRGTPAIWPGPAGWLRRVLAAVSTLEAPLRTVGSTGG